MHDELQRVHLLCSSDNWGGMKRRDKETRKQGNNLAEIPVVVEYRRYNTIPGFSPLLGSPLGCFLISLSRHFIPYLTSTLNTTVDPVLESDVMLQDTL